VIDPVRSRCLGIRIPAPTQPEIMAVLSAVAAKEGVTLPTPVAARLGANCARNLRRALLMFESTVVASGPTGLTPATPFATADWETYVTLLAADVSRDPTPKGLLAARAKIYDLLVNCIPADVIMKVQQVEEGGGGWGGGGGEALVPRLCREARGVRRVRTGAGGKGERGIKAAPLSPSSSTPLLAPPFIFSSLAQRLLANLLERATASPAGEALRHELSAWAAQ
jgi:hypothetical protein